MPRSGRRDQCQAVVSQRQRLRRPGGGIGGPMGRRHGRRGPLVQGEGQACARGVARPTTRARAAQCRGRRRPAPATSTGSRISSRNRRSQVQLVVSRPGRAARSGRRSGARNRRGPTRTAGRSRAASRGPVSGKRHKTAPASTAAAAAAMYPSIASRPPPGQIGMTPPIRRTSEAPPAPSGRSPARRRRRRACGSIGSASATTNGSTQVRCGQAGGDPAARRVGRRRSRGSRSRPIDLGPEPEDGATDQVDPARARGDTSAMPARSAFR